VDPAGGVVSGVLVLHAEVGEHEVTSWTELSIDPPGRSIVIDPQDLRLVEPAADPIAERVAGEYMRRGEGLVPVEGDQDDEQVGDDGKVRPAWEPA
jgi:hypothetical protein